MILSTREIPGELDELLEEVSDSLKPICPSEAIDRYLEYRETELTIQTRSEYRRKLQHFDDFCEDRGITNLNELDGRTINDFAKYRRRESVGCDEPLSNKTMRDDMYLFRSFLSFLEDIEGVPSGSSEKVNIPELGNKDGVRDIEIDSDRVTEILDYLEKYEYASRSHVIWTFFAHTGRRPGGLYGLDLCDLKLEREDPYIHLRHRPDETTLKNGADGETEIYVSEDVAQIFQDYIENSRIDIVTENGREPFLTSSQGRLSQSVIRKDVYRFSRPCVLSKECPHGRDVDSCDAAQSQGSASKCPSSCPPYALRHGYISSKLRQGASVKVISGRCDVSEPVIEKHYDERDEEEKRQVRQKLLEELRENQDGGGFL